MKSTSPALLAAVLAAAILPATAATPAQPGATPARRMEVSCSVLIPASAIPALPGTMHMVEKLVVPAGADAHRHKHDTVELVTIISGTGHITLEGRPDVALKPGVVVEVPAGTVHQQHNASDTEPLVYTATFIGKAGAHALTRYVGEKDKLSGCPHRVRTQ